jgi:hypothetical protein
MAPYAEFIGSDGKGRTVTPAEPLPVDIGAATVEISGDVTADLADIEDSVGAPADAAASSDTGTFSLIALAKRALQNWTTLLGRIPALQSGAVPVNDNSGSLTVDGKAYRAAVTLTRPSNTTAYAAGDVVGIADSGTPANAGSAIITLSSIGPAGGYVLIQSVRLMIGNSTAPASAFRLHLYTESPTAILDNAAFDLVAGDVGKYAGYVDLPAPQDFGSIAVTQSDYAGTMVKLAAASTTLFAQLEARSAYTPASGTLYDLRVLSLEASL